MIFILLFFFISNVSMAFDDSKYPQKLESSRLKNSSKSKPEKSDKKWSLQIANNLSKGGAYEAKVIHSHSLSVSHKYKDYLFSLRSSYSQPFTFVSDPSYFGFTNTSLGVSTSFPRLLNSNWKTYIGLVLPTAKKSIKRSHYLSFLLNLSSQKKIRKNWQGRWSHALYSNLNRYRTDSFGTPNRLDSSSHQAQLVFQTQKINLSVSGVFYFYTYLVDKNSDPEISDTRLNVRGSQGGRVNLSYSIYPRLNAWIHTSMSVNMPVVSPVLTGFPLFNQRNWLYNLGLSWSI